MNGKIGGEYLLARRLLNNLKQELTIEKTEEEWVVTIYPLGTEKSIGDTWKMSRSEDFTDQFASVLADFVLTLNDDDDKV